VIDDGRPVSFLWSSDPGLIVCVGYQIRCPHPGKVTDPRSGPCRRWRRVDDRWRQPVVRHPAGAARRPSVAWGRRCGWRRPG